MSNRTLRVGVVAPSSPIGHLEFERGLDRLRDAGFDVVAHPDATARHFVNAGTDAQRVNAFLDYAHDDLIDVIWCARGGYGASKVVALLDEATKSRGVPSKTKLLVGYSDITFLHEYVRNAWGWRTLHAPMVSVSTTPPSAEVWAAVDAYVRDERPSVPYASPMLKWLSAPPTAPITGEVIGGNLTLWSTMAGTPWQPSARGKILFLEDIGEKIYRIDRMIVQLEQAGMLDGAAAIVLGDFTDCEDETPTMLAPIGEGAEVEWSAGARVPTRPALTLDDGLIEIFGRVSPKLGIRVAKNLPVGHGPGFWPLPLGATFELTVDGALRLQAW